MRTSIFQYPYEKVFRRTQGAISCLGMHVINSDALRGSMTAETNFSLSKPSVKLDLIFRGNGKPQHKGYCSRTSIEKAIFPKTTEH